jgi:hypothetical protein
VEEVSVLAAILHDRMGMLEASSCRVPKMLTPLQKQCMIKSSEKNFRLYEADPETFLWRIVTGDETRAITRTLRRNSSPCDRKISVHSRKGLDTNISWKDYANGVLRFGGNFNSGLRGTQGNGDASAAVLLTDHQGVSLHDNAPVHESGKANTAVGDCDSEELNRPPYNPDLAPRNNILLQKLTRDLRGRRFSSDNELQDSQWSEQQDKGLFLSAISFLLAK